MTGEAWLLIAAGLAVAGGFCGIIVGIAWSNGYAAAMQKATVRETFVKPGWLRDREALAADLRRVIEAPDPIEHFPEGWPERTTYLS